MPPPTQPEPKPPLMARVKEIAPIFEWLPKYDARSDLKFDIIAGVTVAMMLIPQQISLASILKVPPQYCLYNAALGPGIYAIFGSSKVLSVATGAGVALLVGAVLSKIKDEAERVATGIFISFLIGVVLLLIRAFRLSEVADFFSRPVMGGYISSVGLQIMLSQVPSWFSISIGNPVYPAESVYRIIEKIEKTEMHSFTVGLVSILVLMTLKWMKTQFFSNASLNEIFGSSISTTATTPQAKALDHDRLKLVDGSTRTASLREPMLPPDHHGHAFSLNDNEYQQLEAERNARVAVHTDSSPKKRSKSVAILLFIGRTVCDLAPLVVCIGGGIAGYMIGPKEIRVTGFVPSNLANPRVPWYGFSDHISVDRLGDIVMNALSATLVTLVSSLAIAKRLAVQRGQDIRGDQELMSLGIANVVCSFFQAMPATGGLSRTAVNQQNARTQLASIISSVLVTISLYTLTDAVYYVPRATLASIIIVAGYSLVELKEASWLYRVKRDEFYVWLGCFVVTLVLGVDQGLYACLIVSLIGVMVKTKRPTVTILGETDAGDLIDRDDDLCVRDIDDLVVVRVHSSLYFANCVRLTQVIDKELERRRRSSLSSDTARTGPHGVVIDLFRVNDLDATTIQVISDLQEKMHVRGIAFALANANDSIHANLAKTTLMKRIAGQNPQLGLLEAMQRITETRTVVTSPSSADSAA